jgi:hypothetical protein
MPLPLLCASYLRALFLRIPACLFKIGAFLDFCLDLNAVIAVMLKKLKRPVRVVWEF